MIRRTEPIRRPSATAKDGDGVGGNGGVRGVRRAGAQRGVDRRQGRKLCVQVRQGLDHERFITWILGRLEFPHHTRARKLKTGNPPPNDFQWGLRNRFRAAYVLRRWIGPIDTSIELCAIVHGTSSIASWATAQTTDPEPTPPSRE